jgi:hypothetical protein
MASGAGVDIPAMSAGAGVLLRADCFAAGWSAQPIAPSGLEFVLPSQPSRQSGLGVPTEIGANKNVHQGSPGTSGSVELWDIALRNSWRSFA